MMSEILKSKRFWSAVVGGILAVLVIIIPDLEPLQETLLNAIVILIGLLIGGYTIEGTVLAWRGQTKYNSYHAVKE